MVEDCNVCIGGVLLKIGMSSLCRISAILFNLISIICGIGVTISLYEARSDLLGCVKWLPHLALNVVLRTPRHTLLEILTSPMTLNIGKLVSATFGIVGVLLGMKETLPFQLAGLLCAHHSFVLSSYQFVQLACLTSQMISQALRALEKFCCMFGLSKRQTNQDMAYS
ncbi:hypothetical protein K439DRAFT_1069097 [Ramaria rubella]|nr:hypothetical protein K439DRAFT_1069097 [Ramaria rubella]